MNRYLLIHRLRGPVILLLIGTLALLHRMGVIPYFWRLLWPLLLIALGVLLLAERMALGAEDYPPFPGAPWCGPGQGMSQGMNAGTASGAPMQGAGNSAAAAGTAIVPLGWQELENKKEEGQS
jgi:hypothetical protein